MRICAKCGTAKPLDDFYANKLGKEGRGNKCKPCVKAEVREWYRLNRERARADARERYLRKKAEYIARSKAWAEKNRSRRREIVKRWDARNIERKRASGRALNKRKYYADLDKSRALMRLQAKRFGSGLVSVSCRDEVAYHLPGKPSGGGVC